MANPTTNFNWQMPTNTDLVKDLPADFEVFGQAVDTTMADLKGGTTGQILSKASNTDMDFTWIANDQGDITAVTVSSPLTGGGTTGAVSIAIQDGTTAQKGAVQLEDSTSSTSTTKAATPNSVKTSYDLADAAIPKSLVDAKADLITATADNTPARLAVGNNGETLVADSAATTGLRWQANPSASNPLLNSAMDIWQRGTSFTSGSSAYRADRWYSGRGGAVAGGTWSRQGTSDTTNLPNIQYCMRVARDSGNTSTQTFYLSQSIETSNSIPFAGKTVTLSFYARAGANYSATSSILRARLYSGTGTDQNVSETWTGSATPIDQNATLTTTWQRFSYSGTIATTATELGIEFLCTPVGTAGAADYFEITGVQLDIGSVALPFRRAMNTLAGELAACQRYYWRTVADSAYGFLGSGVASSTTAATMFIPPRVTMRVAPTSIDYPTVSTIRYADGANANALTSLALDGNSTKDILAVTATSSGGGMTAGRGTWIQGNNSSTAYIGFSSEL